jgi:hypothetical protein
MPSEALQSSFGRPLFPAIVLPNTLSEKSVQSIGFDVVPGVPLPADVEVRIGSNE